MRLEVDGVSKSFGGTRVLADVSFSASPGIVGLVGVNGAGKTTLLRILSGAIDPDTGGVGVDGGPPDGKRGPSHLRRATALMPQSVVPPRGMTVLDFMNYMAWLRAVPRKVAARRIPSILESVGLIEMRNRRMTELSGGMLRRATFAQALVSDPAILLLDEPTTGVDPEQRLAMRQLIAAQEGERLTILSSHVMEDIETVATRTLMLDAGSLVFDGPLAALRTMGASLVATDSGLSPLEAAFMHLRSGRR